MESRFRKALTTVPAVWIRIGKQGLMTTIGWRSGGIGHGTPSNRLLRQIGDPALAGLLPTDPFLIPGTRKDFGGGNVSDMTSPGLESFKDLLAATRRRENAIRTDLTKVKRQVVLARVIQALAWISLVSVFAQSVRAHVNKTLEARRSELVVLAKNLAATRVSVNFDMDSEIAGPHRKVQDTFDQMASSQRTWSVQTEQRIDRVKARSRANVVMSRAPAAVRRAAASLVDTQDAPLAMTVLRGKATAYFYPGFVLVDRGDTSDFAIIDITQVNVTAGVTNFTENEAVPLDASVIGRTWAKVNKDGSRDRRFPHNREFLILQYGSLNLSGSGSLNEEFMFSNATATANFATAVNELKRLLQRGRAGQPATHPVFMEGPR
jgi:hypothetical protein